MEENRSYAVGHLALGYTAGRISAKLLKTKVNIPLLLTLSVIPDIDILFSRFLEHRGPTHSIITALIIFAPIIAVYRKQALPYCIAVIQHSLIGDYVTGGRIQLLWPVTTQYYGTSISIMSSTNIALEWTMFLISIAVMTKTRDIAKFRAPHNSNLILAIPLFTVLLPAVLSFPLEVPVSLILPHLAYLLLFSLAIILDLSKLLNSTQVKKRL
jgi:membrane-bound metal-dependent hydrolase YbcI (DUF457 family)